VTYTAIEPQFYGKQEGQVGAHNPTSPASGLFAASESVPGQALVLTNAERNVALLVSEGARNHDIARQLGVSHRTVESHLSNIFAKLGLSSRVQLAVWISGAAKPES
jgi:DNA-binding NarL/FixJ family response regulator